MLIKLKKPYLLFLGDAQEEQIAAKTAMGIFQWRPEWCLAQLRTSKNSVKLNLPEMDVPTAAAAGAKTFVIGIANIGGVIDKSWIKVIQLALENGMDVACGMHERLNDISELVEIAKKHNVHIYDVRHYQGPSMIPSEHKRKGKRLLTVGTDCSVGKMTTALAITKEMQARGINAEFRATGQTGIFIAETGIPLDAIPCNFAIGAVELLTPDNKNSHWDIVEGQGGLINPDPLATLALIYGSQPDVMVLCHEATRKVLDGYEEFKMPDPIDNIKPYEQTAQHSNPKAKIIAISVNTKRLPEQEKEKYLLALEKRANLPCVDPLLTGVSRIVDIIQKMK